MIRVIIKATIIVERVAATIVIVDLSLSLFAYCSLTYGFHTVAGILISGGIVSVIYYSGLTTIAGRFCYGLAV